MSRSRLRSVPTGPVDSTGGPGDEDVAVATGILATDLEPALDTAAVGTTAVVVAPSLLDFLR